MKTSKQNSGWRGAHRVAIMEPEMNFNKRMGMIGIELLTKAALCAATVGLIAAITALFLRGE